MIAAQWLELRDALGFEPIPALSAAPGLYALSGPNNAGKTRLLRAMLTAHFGATIRLTDVSPRPMFFEHAMVGAVWPEAPPLTLTWPRNVPAPTPRETYGHVPQEVLLRDADLEALAARWPGLDGHALMILRAELWMNLAPRPATLVHTNRYFGSSTTLRDNADLAEVGLLDWPSLLANLDRGSDSQRESWGAIRAAFNDITEGLAVHVRGATTVRLHVVSNGSPERPLDEVGDGLRDLLGILLRA